MLNLQHGIQAATLACSDPQPLFNPKLYDLLQERHFYTENLNQKCLGTVKLQFPIVDTW